MIPPKKHFLDFENYVIGCLGVGDIICSLNAIENMGREKGRKINLYLVNKEHTKRFDDIVSLMKTEHIEFHYAKWPLDDETRSKSTIFQAFGMDVSWAAGWMRGWGLKTYNTVEHMIKPKEDQHTVSGMVGISFTVNSAPHKNVSHNERFRVIDQLLADGKKVFYFGYVEKHDFFLKHRYGDRITFAPYDLGETFKLIGQCESFVGADSGMAWLAAFQRVPTQILVGRGMTRLPKTFSEIPWVTIAHEQTPITPVDGTRRILIVGSGFGVNEWYLANKAKLGFFHEVHAINNAMRIFETPFVHHVSTDFYQYNEKPTEETTKLMTQIICGTSLKHPLHMTLEKGSQTMFIDTCCHMFNKYGFECVVYVIGCDFDYNGPTSHFYGKGGRDPLRLGREKLVINLKVLGLLGIFRNLSGNPKSLLPFEQVTLP